MSAGINDVVMTAFYKKASELVKEADFWTSLKNGLEGVTHGGAFVSGGGGQASKEFSAWQKARSSRPPPMKATPSKPPSMPPAAATPSKPPPPSGPLNPSGGWYTGPR